MKVTFLGTGTSQGVPVIACECEVCSSKDVRDKRFRSSIMISVNDRNFVIDSGPDFRMQMLNNKVKTLSGILFTHEHKDHVAGLDDVRAFNYLENRNMEIYCSEFVFGCLKREFHYVFRENPYPGIPQVNVNIIKNEPFDLVTGESIVPIEVMHYKLPVFGYRWGNFTYITDAKTISEKEKEKVKGSKVLVVNALRENEHISHFTLEEALRFIEEIAPERAYLTHVSHLFGTHEYIQSKLPENVFVAYDELTIEIDV
ncbi:MAG: MBL fold metallo-hydrolase [Crocinitomicaceae bacterium]|nr:MBL fold metallo-hydrolase [Crocinitomicaceae bacterium]